MESKQKKWITVGLGLEVEEPDTTSCLPSASELWTWYDQLGLSPSLPWHEEPHHFLL